MGICTAKEAVFLGKIIRHFCAIFYVNIRRIWFLDSLFSIRSFTDDVEKWGLIAPQSDNLSHVSMHWSVVRNMGQAFLYGMISFLVTKHKNFAQLRTLDFFTLSFCLPKLLGTEPPFSWTTGFWKKTWYRPNLCFNVTQTIEFLILFKSFQCKIGFITFFCGLEAVCWI